MTNAKSLIENYFNLQDEVFKYFGYVEDWKIIPMCSQLNHHWMICGPEDNSNTKIVYSPSPFTKEMIERGSDLYSGTIYTQRFLPKWVYRGADLTMIAVDMHSDGNQVLMIFENSMECTDQAMKDIYGKCWGNVWYD